MSSVLSVSVGIGAKLLPSLGATAKAVEQRFAQMGNRLRLMSAESKATFTGMQRDFGTFATHVSAPAGIVAGMGARAVYEWSKVGNELQAVTQMSAQARKEIEAVARSMPGNPADNLSAALDLARTGFDAKAIQATLPVSLKLGKADSSVTQAESADILTNVLKGMQMPDKSFAQTKSSAERVANNLAFAASNSSTDVRLMGESFKYAGPLAARLGIDIEALSGAFMTMSDNGIKGSEAGVALRSGLVRLLKPTKGAMAVLERYNMKLGDYVSFRNKLTGEGLVASLKTQGIDATGAVSSINSILASDLSGGDLIARISEVVAKGIEGGADAADLDKISDGVAMALTAGADKVNLEKFLKDAQARNWGASEFVNFFDTRQGARLSTLFTADTAKNIERVRAAMRGMKGEGNFLDKMYAMQMQGAVGPFERLKQSFGNLFISMAESGAMDAIAGGMDRIASAVMALSKSSPGVLKALTLGLGGLAVAAPLGFALSGAAVAFRMFASAAGFVGRMVLPLVNRLIPLRVLMVGARYGFLAALGVAGPFAAALAAVGVAIAVIAAKWNGIKAFFTGFADGFRKAVPPEARATLARLGSGFMSLLNALNPVTSALRTLGSVFAPVWKWISQIFAPAEAAKWGSWGQSAGNAVGIVANALARLVGWLERAIGKMRELKNSLPKFNIGLAGSGPAAPAPGAARGSFQAGLAGKRSFGGPVRAGMPYMVGERGREVFVPKSNGNIVPNHKIGEFPRRPQARPNAAGTLQSSPDVVGRLLAAADRLARPAGEAQRHAGAQRRGSVSAHPERNQPSRQVIVQPGGIVIHGSSDPVAMERAMERVLGRIMGSNDRYMSD